MFTVGKVYQIRMIEGAGEVEWANCKVLEVEWPVIKVRQFDKEIIINTVSFHFVAAEPQE